jgi:hypothetical protein
VTSIWSSEIEQRRDIVATAAHHLKRLRAGSPDRQVRNHVAAGIGPQRISDLPLRQCFQPPAGERLDHDAGGRSVQPRAFQKRKVEQCAIRAAGVRFGGRIAKIVR